MDVDKIGPSEHELREEFEKGLQESSLGRWAQARDPDAAAQAVQRLASRYVGEMQLPVVDRPGFLQISKPPPTTGWVVFLMSFVVLWLAASVAGLIQHVVDPLLRDQPPSLGTLAGWLVLPLIGLGAAFIGLARLTITVNGSTIERRVAVGSLGFSRHIPCREVKRVYVKTGKDGDGDPWYSVIVTTKDGRRHDLGSWGAYPAPRIAALLEQHLKQLTIA